ncbi:MAG TPA: tripartite tricarboxylate transporter substrate binding protein [Xanthobacteraceae bacterium]|jgi:tripartite-type tricarboxylate transporter receptor subunit TctC
MTHSRRRFLTWAAGAAALPATWRFAGAQAYPTRPVRWIVGFPPGGGADTVARIVAPWLSDRLGQQVVVENRPGASTNIAVQAVVSSPPDGYTLLFYGASSVVNTSIFANLPFDVQRDIAPVSGLVAYPMVLVAHPSVPAKTVAELIAYAKATPGKVTMASFGTGSASHLAGELFKMMAGVNMVHVPYRGGAPMITDLVGGQVQIGFDVMTTSLPHIRTGALRALAVAGQNRFDMLPDVPSIAETLPGYEARTWAGVGVPRGTPPEIIARLERDINAGLAEPTIKARLAEIGTIPMILTAAEFGAYVAAESEKWAKVVKFAGIKPQ